MSRKKILILGCSYSAGSYHVTYNHSTHINRGMPDGGNEECKPGSFGWYNYIDKLKGHETLVISFPGCGLMGYAQALFHFEKANSKKFTKHVLKDFDYIIIQESYEPRVWLGTDLIFEEAERTVFEGHQIERMTLDHKLGITFYRGALHGKDHIMRGTDNRIYNLFHIIAYNINHLRNPLYRDDSFLKILAEFSGNFIENLCDKYNIQGYRFNLFEDVSPSHLKKSKFKRLNAPKLATLSDYMVKTHLTEEGNEYIGKTINEGLEL